MSGKKLTISLPEKVHTELKLIAVKHGTTMKDLILECVEKIISEHKEK